MGVKRRLIWLGLGMILCHLCVGCGVRESKITQEQAVPFKYMPEILESKKVIGTEASKETQNYIITEESDVIQESKQPEVPVITCEPMEPGEPIITQEPKQPEAPVIICEPKQTEAPVITQEPKQPEVPVTTRASQNTIVLTVTPTPEAIQTVVETQTDNVEQEDKKHIHSMAIKKQEPTCLTNGLSSEYCESCMEVQNEQFIPALGHDFIKSVWELPTCMKGGYYNNVCKRCGLVECVTQEPLPHEAEDILIQEGNCMEDTVIQHVCKVCGVKVKNDTRYTLYDVHLWVNIEVDGETVNCCERCGVTK